MENKKICLSCFLTLWISIPHSFEQIVYRFRRFKFTFYSNYAFIDFLLIYVVGYYSWQLQSWSQNTISYNNTSNGVLYNNICDFFNINLLIRVNETWMNSFLFNIGIILLCSVSLCHFCTVAFSQYARFTSLDLIFSVQVKYLKFFKYFFANKVFEYIILVCFIYYINITSINSLKKNYKGGQRFERSLLYGNCYQKTEGNCI